MTKPTEEHFSGRMDAMGSLKGPVETDSRDTRVEMVSGVGSPAPIGTLRWKNTGEIMAGEQIDAMEAGLEMDLSVARACRMEESEIVNGRCVRVSEVFTPSTRWTDAMFAAERFGLFTTHGMILGHDGKEWVVTEDAEPIAPEFPGTRGATGPLAICRAILKLHAGGER